jgi:hypothetical protein
MVLWDDELDGPVSNGRRVPFIFQNKVRFFVDIAREIGGSASK